MLGNRPRARSVVHGDVIQLRVKRTLRDFDDWNAPCDPRQCFAGHRPGENGQPVDPAGDVGQHGLVVFRIAPADQQCLPAAPAFELNSPLDLVHIQRKQPKILVLAFRVCLCGVVALRVPSLDAVGRVQQEVVGK
ncbi:hypothetical protein D9M72_515650 [compost metagenome]